MLVIGPEATRSEHGDPEGLASIRTCRLSYRASSGSDLHVFLGFQKNWRVSARGAQEHQPRISVQAQRQSRAGRPEERDRLIAMRSGQLLWPDLASIAWARVRETLTKKLPMLSKTRLCTQVGVLDYDPFSGGSAQPCAYGRAFSTVLYAEDQFYPG